MPRTVLTASKPLDARLELLLLTNIVTLALLGDMRMDIVKRKPELRTRSTRRYAYQRVKYENPKVIGE